MSKKEQKKKIFLFPLLAWILLFVYLFLGPRIYTYLIQDIGSPISRDIEITNFSSSKKARGFVRALSPYQNKPDIYQINGWAFSKLTPEEPTNVYVTEIVVFNESRNYLFETKSIERADIIDNFSALNLTIINPGFSGLINKHAIFYGKYCIAIKLTHSQNQISQFILSNKVLRKTLLHFELEIDDGLFCKSIIDD